MAKFSAAIVAVAVLAVFVSQEVRGQEPEDANTVPIGGACQYRGQCIASQCPPNTSVCCVGLKIASATSVYSFGSGKCTCCSSTCNAKLSNGEAHTEHTSASADVYDQECKK